MLIALAAAFSSASAGQRVGAIVRVQPRWTVGTLPKTAPYQPHFPQNPAIGWRGIHLFVGPRALKFQAKLIQRVLKPLGFNYVVLECERTKWKSAPGISDPLATSREDLLRLFELYRRNHIEPIPLIESFGHMRWLLGTKRYANLSLGPGNLNPGNPKGTRLIARIWKEAVHLLKPKVVHFGLDEVDLPLSVDETRRTKLWSSQVRFLTKVAKDLGVRPMFWGDEFLAPGEGPDNCNAHSRKESEARRRLLPKGCLIGDWHYLANANGDAYNSLGLWKKCGQSPIASEWNQLPNIVGFTAAARQFKAGTLVTTWAGYSSDEASLLANYDQFAAFVFASEANTDPAEAASQLHLAPSILENNLRAKLQKLYFGSSHKGGEGFAAQLNYPMRVRAGNLAVLQCGHKGKALLLSVSSRQSPKEGAPMVEVSLRYQDGVVERRRLRSGYDVATTRFPATSRAEAGCSRLNLRPVRLDSIQVRCIGSVGFDVSQVEIAL